MPVARVCYIMSLRLHFGFHIRDTRDTQKNWKIKSLHDSARCESVCMLLVTHPSIYLSNCVCLLAEVLLTHLPGRHCFAFHISVGTLVLLTHCLTHRLQIAAKLCHASLYPSRLPIAESLANLPRAGLRIFCMVAAASQPSK